MTHSRSSFKRKWLLKTARNSFLTSLALDSIGTIFEDYSKEERDAWFSGARTAYPKSKKVRKASFNSDFVVVMMLSLMQSLPLRLEDMCAYDDDLTTFLQSYYYMVASPRTDNRYVLSLQGQSDTGIVFSIAMCLGVYAACMGIQRDMLIMLVTTVAKKVGLHRRDWPSALALAYLSYRLLREAYFGYTYFTELLAQNMVPPFAYSVFTEMMENHHNVGYLSQSFSTHKRVGVSNTEDTIMRAMYHMCRVDLGCHKTLMPSGPKDQLHDLFDDDSDKHRFADFGFVYGGLCTLSEQLYSLVTKPLREGVVSRQVVDDFFGCME